jgi:hypothetical protein
MNLRAIMGSRWTSIFIGVIIGGLAGIAFISWVGANPAVISDAPATQVVSSDEHCHCLNILYDVTRVRRCTTHTTRILWRPQDDPKLGHIRQLLFLQDTGTAFPEVGEQRVVLSIPLPQGISAGAWFYRSAADEQCGLFPWFSPAKVRVSADVPVVIPVDSP